MSNVLKNDATPGVILIISAAAAMILSNTPGGAYYYQQFFSAPVKLVLGPVDIDKNLLLWVNDAMMAVFFLYIGLEVKKELISGSLASLRRASFPLAAAVGGMLAPAFIYLLFNGADVISRDGWAIPAATDIAFALGILALVGSNVHPALKIFLMALAIIDDLGAILIIAVFYTNDLSFAALAWGAIAITVMAVMNVCGIKKTSIYMLAGVILWTAVLKSGVHATLAGVITGLLIPMRGKSNHSPVDKLSHALHPWVAFFILPVFAFANAGISLDGVTISDVTALLPAGIAAGLLLGKPVGIGLCCWIVVRLRIASLPEGTNWQDILAVSMLCGIGFTMSIFISTLAFGDADSQLLVQAKTGILIGSLLSALTGFVLLRRQSKKFIKKVVFIPAALSCGDSMTSTR